MKPSSNFAEAAVAVLLLAAPTVAINLSCDHVRADETSWDLSKLDKEYTLVDYHYRDTTEPKNVSRVTFNFNPCKQLDVEDKKKACPRGTFVCGVEDHMDEKDEDEADKAVSKYSVAGNYLLGSGYRLDPHWTRLKTSPIGSDNKQEGVRLEMYGHYDEMDKSIRYKAEINFVCKNKEDRRSITRLNEERDDDKEGDDDSDGGDDEEDPDIYKKHPDLLKKRSTDDEEGGTISIESWGRLEKAEKKNKYNRVLVLNWETKYACETAYDDPDLDHGSEGGWGFFSWLFFLSFIGILGYFCFFAWINYSRYGKSGFDMLPHADTLRELPQLLGEYTGKVVNTLRGGNSSGGYSAL